MDRIVQDWLEDQFSSDEDMESMDLSGPVPKKIKLDSAMSNDTTSNANGTTPDDSTSNANGTTPDDSTSNANGTTPDDSTPNANDTTSNANGTTPDDSMPNVNGTTSNDATPINEGTSEPIDELLYTITRGPTKNFNTTAQDTSFYINLGDNWQGLHLGQVLDRLRLVFDNVLVSVQENANDRIRVVFRHPDLENPIVVSARKNMTADDILQVLEKTLTSYRNLDITKDFQIIVGVIRLPQGEGKRQYVVNLARDIPSKKSIVQIENKDTMCAARATVVAYTKSCIVHDVVFDEATKCLKGSNVDKVLESGKATSSFYRNIRKSDQGRRREQLDMAIKLCQKAHVSPQHPCSLDELKNFEDVLDRNICVIQAEEGNKFVRRSSHRNRTNLYLYLHDGHYDAIVSMTGFFNSSYFCQDCLQPYTTKNKHSCETHCTTCTSQFCKVEDPITCPDCNQLCRNPGCMLRHKLTPFKNSNMCEAFYKCDTCQKVMPSSRRDTHQCGEWQCKSCQAWVLGDHLCYIRALDVEESLDRFIFYDFETTQESTFHCKDGYTPLQPQGCQSCNPNHLCNTCSKCIHCQDLACGSKQHIPNLVVVRTVCDNCINTDEKLCHTCGLRCTICTKRACYRCPKTTEIVFRNSVAFCEWLFSKPNENATCIAHNAKAFDDYFILSYLSKQGIPPTNVIFNGTKIMYFKVEKGLNMRFVDSYNFLAMPLANLPKAFGFDELKKGYFPHFFNKYVNRDYVGPLPDPSYYGVDSMNSDARQTFLNWHEKRKREGVFDFDKELVEYCKSDVDILMKACLKYRELMLDTTSVDPFTCVTVASTAMKVFKTNFLKEKWSVQLEGGSWHDATYQNSQFKIHTPDGDKVQGLVIKDKKFMSTPLAQVPAHGYTTHVTFSKSSIQWLEWTSHSEKIHIRHALNGRGEQKVGGYYVDGLCDKTVYEFNGCFWHGCPTCYPLDRTKVKHPRTQQSMSELYALTRKKCQVLKSLGYNVIIKWEHEFMTDLKTNPDCKRFVDSLDLVDRLDPRDSFFGGRTNALTLHYKVKADDEEVRYVDFTSLYPFVNKYKEYPVGHPEIITRDFKPLHEYFGIAKIKILPPRGLYLPVLPYKSKGKLKFPLCKTCADLECQTECHCLDNDRALLGTWCIPEILKALEMGYRLLNIYEVYHFNETSKYENDGGLFASYVDTFLKYKQESSDWPQWCDTEENKQKYLTDYFENEGVKLDRFNIKKNPGKRSLSKIKLNSFWGKFGQRRNFNKSQYFSSKQLAEFYSLITDQSKELKNFHIINDNLIIVEYCDADHQTVDDNISNIFIATFTTAHARLHLYSIMEPLGERVLYHDTDSIIYVHKPNLVNPQLGDYLGQLTDELDGDSIIEFISAGPKNYAYKTKFGQEVCKVRGFRLNYKNSQLINFSVIKDIVTNDKTRCVHTVDKKILRNKWTTVLYNSERTKMYRLVYDKRMLRGVFTLPYGY